MVCNRHRAYTQSLAALFQPLTATYSAVLNYAKSAYDSLIEMVGDYAQNVRSTYDENTNREGNYQFGKIRIEPIFGNSITYQATADHEITHASAGEGGLAASKPLQLEEKVELIDLDKNKKQNIEQLREEYQDHINKVLRYRPHTPRRLPAPELAHNIINELPNPLEAAIKAFNEPVKQVQEIYNV
ncbi:MAG: hypothetical protein ACE5FT_05125 [Candidatus Nanoarchaeia archaeon]